MKQFFKFLLASCLGTILAGVAVFSIFGAFAGALLGGKESPKVEANSILHLDLGAVLPEKTNNVAVSGLTDPFAGDVLGLNDVLRCIEKAKDDNNIKGIVIETEGLSAGSASLSVLRRALLDFKESGKFVLAYANYYSQKGYGLASVSDSLFLHPNGGLDFNGFSAQIPFFKDMLDRLGIKMQVFYVGNFKGATEPFRLNELSEYNRQQIREYINSLYDVYLDEVAAARSLNKADLYRIADGYLVRKAEDAVQYGLADGTIYRDEFLDMLRRRLGKDKGESINMVALADYAEGLSKDYKERNKIAVVYAEGDIVDGDMEAGTIGGEGYAAMIRKIREKGNVKAIVLRVNSGGGSALASENILRELRKAQEEGIPVVVSMGDVAASGGYLISCYADTIVAEPNTITGSIGVFGVIPSLEGMLRDKAGITFDTVKTARYSVGVSPFQDISPEEGAIVQAMVEDFYDEFLRMVSEGRGMSRDSAHAVAQGRVWTGKKALELGLVDVLGDLDDAIAIAARMAGVESYRLSEYPQSKSPMEELLSQLTGEKDEEQVKQMLLNEGLGTWYPYYRQAERLRQMQGVQARMPFEIVIE